MPLHRDQNPLNPLPITRPNTYRKGLRVARFYNETNQTIPSFALMQLKRPLNRPSNPSIYDPDAEEDEFFCQEQLNEDVVWSASICDEEAAARQNPAQFAFNLEKPIPRRQTGEGTFDTPAQVLHNGDSDSLPNWRACGPVAGRWWVLSGGSAFTCISHDACQVVGSRSVHTVWVRPNSRNSAANLKAQGSSVSADAYVPLHEIESSGIDIEDPWAIVRRSGMFQFGFAAKVSSTDAPRGTDLLLQIWKRSGETGAINSTIWWGDRDQDIEEDQYGAQILYTGENVAFTGWENLNRNDALAIRNLSGVHLTLTRSSFWMLQTAVFREAASQSGGLSFESA
jgi:hypothetical protein